MKTSSRSSHPQRGNERHREAISVCTHLHQITNGISVPSVSNPISVLKTKGDKHSFKHTPWGKKEKEKWLCGRFRGRETQPLRAITLFECACLHRPSAGFSRKTSRRSFSITCHPLQSSTEIQSTSSSPRKAKTCLIAKILTSELKGIHTRNC